MYRGQLTVAQEARDVAVNRGGTARRLVEREQFLSLLDAWERIIGTAERLQRRVVCFGD